MSRRFGKPLSIDDIKHIAFYELIRNSSIVRYEYDFEKNGFIYHQCGGRSPALGRIGRAIGQVSVAFEGFEQVARRAAEAFESFGAQVNSALGSGLAHKVNSNTGKEVQ